MTAANPFNTDNRPFWTPATPPGWQEVWYMKLNDTGAGRALWLRFTLLTRKDGSKAVAEVWAIFFARGEAGISKVGIKNTFPIAEFKPGAAEAPPAFEIAQSQFSDANTWGMVDSADHRIRWNFLMQPKTPLACDLVPASLKRWGLVKNTAVNVFEDWRFTGYCEVDGARYDFAAAPGMQGHLAGVKNGHSWAWGHCNTFVDEHGEAVSCVFDGLSARARLGGGLKTPPLTTLFFYYDDEAHCCTSFRDARRNRSHYSPTEWVAEGRSGDRLFQARLRASLEDFAGVTYEDTDGSALYCHNSKISDMVLEVRRDGALERRLEAVGSVAYEFVSREKHPEVSFVI